MKFITSINYKNCDAIYLSGTKALKENDMLKRKNNEKIFIHIQCSLDLSKVGRNSIAFDYLESKKKILYFLQITELKGLDILIRAFSNIKKKIPNVILLIYGDGEFLKECKELACYLCLGNVYWGGEVCDSNFKAAIFNECDIFVLPSKITKQIEAWGLVVNEAMSMGKPIIVTNALGSSDDLVINDYNGYIVNHSSVNELETAIIKILSNDDKIREMGKRSRQIFGEKNDYLNMVNAFRKAVDFALYRNKI